MSDRPRNLNTVIEVLESAIEAEADHVALVYRKPDGNWVSSSGRSTDEWDIIEMLGAVKLLESDILRYWYATAKDPRFLK